MARVVRFRMLVNRQFMSKEPLRIQRILSRFIPTLVALWVDPSVAFAVVILRSDTLPGCFDQGTILQTLHGTPNTCVSEGAGSQTWVKVTYQAGEYTPAYCQSYCEANAKCDGQGLCGVSYCGQGGVGCQCCSDPSSGSGSVAPAPAPAPAPISPTSGANNNDSSGKHEHEAGAIAGGIVGSVLFIIAIGAYIVWRRRAISSRDIELQQGSA
jgi:hypothetical protein